MLDKVVLLVKAGNGGDGVVSFRRERFVPYGGADGGNGGTGGAVIIKADAGISNLNMFKNKRHYLAGNGSYGGGQKKHGKKGKTLVLTVPVGTIVLNKTIEAESDFISDLIQSGEQVVVA